MEGERRGVAIAHGRTARTRGAKGRTRTEVASRYHSAMSTMTHGAYLASIEFDERDCEEQGVEPEKPGLG